MVRSLGGVYGERWMVMRRVKRNGEEGAKGARGVAGRRGAGGGKGERTMADGPATGKRCRRAERVEGRARALGRDGGHSVANPVQVQFAPCYSSWLVLRFTSYSRLVQPWPAKCALPSRSSRPSSSPSPAPP